MGSFTFASSAAILEAAGKGVSNEVSNALLLRFSNQAESLINGTARHNLVDDYATLDADLKEILQDIAASYAGKKALKYDTSGYQSRSEAELIADMLTDDYKAGLNLIKEDKWKKFAGVT